MGRSTALTFGLCLIALLLTSCNPFDQGTEVAESQPTATQAAPVATLTPLPPTTTPTNPPAAPTATEVPPTETPTQSPPTPTVAATWLVGNTGGDGVFIRRTTDMDDKIKAWPDGTEMTVVGPDVTAEGRLWRNVQDPDGNEGFVPADYLVVPEGTDPPAADTETPSADPDESTPAPDTTDVTYVVANTGGSGVYIRSTLDPADRIKAWPDGTNMVVVGPDVTEDGVVWKNVRDPDGNEGFVPADYLVPAEEETTEAAAPAATPEANSSSGNATPDASSRPPKDDSY